MKRIPLSLPHMGENERKYVDEAFTTNWLTSLGPNVSAFEDAFERHIGRPALALSSGTAALHLGLRLLGVGPGDRVIVPTLTFVASVNPIVYLGGTPVFVDSERASWNLDPELLDEALGALEKRGAPAKAVVVVHLFGQSADMARIVAVCARHGVALLEDAAEAMGTEYRGKRAGSIAPVAAFSFNGNKIITTTSGGMLVAEDRALIDKARHWATQAREPRLEYHHVEMGYNYRMSNVLAGIGRGQLEVLDARVQARRRVAKRYWDAFAELDGIAPMPQASWGLHTNWLSVFLLDEERFGCTRDALIGKLADDAIESRPVWKPMHLQPLYASVERFGGAVAEDVFSRGIALPSSSSLSDEEQARVIAGVCAAGRSMVARP